MPVPKGKQELYGKVVGHMINSGKSFAHAKHTADKAVSSESTKHPDKARKCKTCGKKHTSSEGHE